MEQGGRIDREAALAEAIASELHAAARFHERAGNDAVAEALRRDAGRQAREAVTLRLQAEPSPTLPA
ncbi:MULTISPECIES: hypothetical protein [Methylobacterium]|uniref:hypothetical protein n=1 Tax=Methylobacterium TaxID=407 RepID=UPI00104E9DC9|nr:MULTISPECIES: hypothetical protein [Methylobacterium]MDR7040211.1 hypothetical protein [Methylobacterium sp. BE186]